MNPSYSHFKKIEKLKEEMTLTVNEQPDYYFHALHTIRENKMNNMSNKINSTRQSKISEGP
jgi:hypothetical protein